MRKAAPPASAPLAVALPVALSMAVVVAIVIAGTVVGLSRAHVASTSLATKSTTLRPGFPDKLTKSLAKSETEHYAKVITALVRTTDIASMRTEEELVPSAGSSGPYYAVISTLTLVPRANAIEDATAIKNQLVAAGWISHSSATKSSQYLAALASSKSTKTAWFLELGATDIPGQPSTVTIEIGSPGLPKT